VNLTGLVKFGMDVALTGGHFLSLLQRPLPMLIGVTRAFCYSRLPGGYWLPRWLGRDGRAYLNQAIGVGMRNSVLAVALAVENFTVTAALPGALFSILHNLGGSLQSACRNRQSRQ